MRLVRAFVGLDALWQFEILVETALEVGALLGLAWLAGRALRNRPAARHAAWSLGLAAALLLPIAGAIVPQRAIHYPLPSALVHLDNVPDLGPLRRAAVTVVAPELIEPATRVSDGHVAGPGPLAWALLAWAAGTLVAAARLALATRRWRGIVRRATEVRDPRDRRALASVRARLGARRARLLESDEIEVPFTCGILGPAIVLPRKRAWSPETRDLVLTHELAHVRRYDAILHLVGGIASALYWFHPLVRVAASRQREEAEHAADAAVLGTGIEARAYARGLLAVVRDARATPSAAVALPFADPTRLEGRVRTILAPRAGGRRTLAIALVFALLAAGAAGAALVRPAVAPVGAAPCASEASTSSGPFFVHKCQSISTQEGA